jgi:hypothetical protein
MLSQRNFRDRREAGRLLAEKLAVFANRPDVIVLALPRGGVPVAYEVARSREASKSSIRISKIPRRTTGRPPSGCSICCCESDISKSVGHRLKGDFSD